MISKIDLRKQFIEKRKILNTDVLSDLICKNITGLEIYKQSKNIFAYYPKEYEVNILKLFEDKSKCWFLPKIEGETLKFYEYKGNLVLGKFNVYEPKENVFLEVTPDLIIVPALSVDNKGYRLGYGKGYYDRFLAGYETLPKTLTPIFNDLMVELLPVESTDKKIDIIVSENKIEEF